LYASSSKCISRTGVAAYLLNDVMLFNRMMFLQSSAVELTGSYLGREDREEERGGKGEEGGGGR
jgi:hypothetical protein